ncbi:GatB/YqeY domain-containing protein [Patescibacteria group bacterium]|nr:GatB/YqeY domain-containing protein [Patescibacteria group bacterium]MBU1472892.1 GatB/YqeY domain-containing protein [Patescibacteria group bacterium]MBU2459793.1 GatB/YqeY domain-containing protein [Patescibacteria group bacterium]MBU2544814.1 GatB/YqeY domain-containing protein [Patescibacteria group bacterium]
MTLNDLKIDLNASLKKGDTVRVATLRFLLAAIQNAGIAKYGKEVDTKITEEDILDCIKKQVKTHKESIEAFTAANRPELSSKERDELTILEKFLPDQMTDEELVVLLKPIAAGGETNFGLLMKQAMAIVKRKADGGRVAAMLKNMLSE